MTIFRNTAPNIAETARDIFEQTYLQPFSGLVKGNLYVPPIERPIHGAMHAARVAAYIKILITLCQVCGIREALVLTPEHITLLQIVGLYHDAARKNDDVDKWEEQSAELCEAYLTKIISSALAKEYASLISKKTDVGFCGKLLQSADCLDIIRTKPEFDIKQVSLYRDHYYNNHFRETFHEIVREVHALIELQHDLKYDCTVCIDGKKFTRRATPNFHMSSVKRGYEHAQNCYEKITSDFHKFAYINAYHNATVDSLRKASGCEGISMKTPAVFPEKFLIKSIRAEPGFYFDPPSSSIIWYYDFWCNFIYGVTKTASDHTEHDLDLRMGSKKKFTVTGKGVFKRAEKSPQYSTEKKVGYSQPQSTSYGTRTQPAPLCRRQGKAVGVLFPLKQENVLLTNRLMLFNGGTVRRSYDFDNQNDAHRYYQKRKDSTLFSCGQFDQFESAVSNTRDFKPSEVMARLKWTMECKIIIGADDLESRLIAQDRARTLKARLKEQASELGASWDDAYEVPIIFYMPYDDKHGNEYTKLMQEQDRSSAKDIASSKEQRQSKYKNKNFEFLLGLDEGKIRKVLSEDGNLALQILNIGYVHIVGSLLELTPWCKYIIKNYGGMLTIYYV